MERCRFSLHYPRHFRTQFDIHFIFLHNEYDGVKSLHISLSYIAHLQVVGVVDKFWVNCRLDLRRGLVPSANVSPILLFPLEPGQRICVARSGYIAQHSPADMDLNKGESFSVANNKSSHSVHLYIIYICTYLISVHLYGK